MKTKRYVKRVTKNSSPSGCGPTLGIDNLEKGDAVLVIGSGDGSDCFRASQKVGRIGKVFGIDMDNEKISKAKKFLSKKDCKNIEFRRGLAEDLPVEDSSIDVVISHCVMNLVSNKQKACKEIYRVLKKGGKMYVSDVVLLGELSKVQRDDKDFMNECIKGALRKNDYLKMLKNSGFSMMISLKDNSSRNKQQKNSSIDRLEMVLEK